MNYRSFSTENHFFSQKKPIIINKIFNALSSIVLLIGIAITLLLVAGTARSSQLYTGAENLYVHTDGTLWAWGKDTTYYASSDKKAFDGFRSTPMLINEDSDWKAVSHKLALKQDGSLWRISIQINYEQTDSGFGPVRKPYLQRVGTDTDWNTITSLSVGLFDSNTVLAIKNDGTLWSMGTSKHGLLGDGGIDYSRYYPEQIGTDADWVYVKLANKQAFAIKQDGSLWAWGDNSFGQLGLGHSDNQTTPARVGVDNDWKAIAVTELVVYGLKQNGTLYAWSSISPYTYVPEPFDLNDVWHHISADEDTIVAIKQDGSVWGWGNNNSQELGNGIYSYRAPVQIIDGFNWAFAEIGDHHLIAINQNGTLWSRGSNISGGLGDATNNIILQPTSINTNLAVDELFPGENFTIAKTTDQNLHAWGLNYSGQLAQGTRDSSNTAVPVVAGETWVKVVFDSALIYGLKTDGTLWTWGQERLSPVQFSLDTDWADISISHDHKLAIKQDGTLWSWGSNSYGQLGNGGAKTYTFLPELVGTDTDWLLVKTNRYLSFAIKQDGSLWCQG